MKMNKKYLFFQPSEEFAQGNSILDLWGGMQQGNQTICDCVVNRF